jgi:hypothetical protein
VLLYRQVDGLMQQRKHSSLFLQDACHVPAAQGELQSPKAWYAWLKRQLRLKGLEL